MKKVKVKVTCFLCKGKKKAMSMCGGSRKTMHSCFNGECSIDHKLEDCAACKGLGYLAEERELYDDY